jgi:hypothetical protein
MMNSYAMLNFTIQKSQDRAYVFQFLPGTTWEEIYAALDEFKAEFEKLKIETDKKAATEAEQAIKDEAPKEG